jgi:hypothetical protein
MKEQYFGDINDYCKYATLRILTKVGKLKGTICWMLTRDDGRRDGWRTKYLEKPEKWRRLDPKLFDFLRHVVCDLKKRDLTLLENSGLLANCNFHRDIYEDAESSQSHYFEKLKDKTKGVDFVFFDPDNGLEVESKPLGRKDSSKYLYRQYLTPIYKSGKSVLIYQHFPRKKRDRYIREIQREIKKRTGNGWAPAIRTPHTVFLFGICKRHKSKFEKSLDEIERIKEKCPAANLTIYWDK